MYIVAQVSETCSFFITFISSLTGIIKSTKEAYSYSLDKILFLLNLVYISFDFVISNILDSENET